VFDRWLVQKQAISVIFCHIESLKTGNKKPLSFVGEQGLLSCDSGETRTHGQWLKRAERSHRQTVIIFGK